MVIGAPSCGHRPSATFGGRLHGVLPESEIPRRGQNGVSNMPREASGNKIT
jgi:hypothetical protein